MKNQHWSDVNNWFYVSTPLATCAFRVERGIVRETCPFFYRKYMNVFWRVVVRELENYAVIMPLSDVVEESHPQHKQMVEEAQMKPTGMFT